MKRSGLRTRLAIIECCSYISFHTKGFLVTKEHFLLQMASRASFVVACVVTIKEPDVRSETK